MSYLKATKRILRYIKGTQYYSLFYSSSNNLNLVGYSNSDLAEIMMIERAHQDLSFILEEMCSYGLLRCNLQWLSLHMKRNKQQLHPAYVMQFGYATFLESSKFQKERQKYVLTTNSPQNLRRIPSIMIEANKQIQGFTSFEIASKKASWSLFTQGLRIKKQTFSQRH